MAYFNHAFCKTFLGTKVNSSANPDFNSDQSDSNAPANAFSGFIFDNANAPVIPDPINPPINNYRTSDLILNRLPGQAFGLGLGSYGFFDPKTWQTVTTVGPQGVSACCPLVLAATALYQKDGIGQPFSGGGIAGNFHGGYQESNKSKVINPKYVSQLYKVTPCVPNQNVVHVGATPYTAAQQLDCCKEFLCDQAYTLRIDIKGSPALRALNHNSYFETSTWTGCCPAGALAPVAVDPTTVYLYWATQLINSPLVNPFIQIIVFDQFGNPVGGSNDTAAWEAYVAQPVVPCVPAAPGAGMTIVGAYVDTKFGDCTFYPTDFFEKQPVQIYASMVDLTGDVCEFTGICVNESCCPRQGNGFGDTVLKDLILSERYQQNDFYTGDDLRIREITQGYDVSNAINRSSLYTRYVIQHNVPRFNNPTGTFDNDQYQLEIITNGTDPNLELFFQTWITSPICGTCDGLETFDCKTPCCEVPVAGPYATDGQPYTYNFPVPTGTAPFAWTDDGGLAGAGLSVDPLTGAITGVVGGGAAGYVAVINVTDAFGNVVGCFTFYLTVLA